MSRLSRKCIVAPDDPAGYAHVLYAAMHELDDCGAKRILVQAPPTDPAWAAVNDRLGRAAAEKNQLG